MNMNIKLEQLQKAVDDASEEIQKADDDAAWAAYVAYCKARQELEDYKKESGL